MPRTVTPLLLLLAVAWFAAACGDDPAAPAGGQVENVDEGAHGGAHAHTAPHGGLLVICRGEFAHVELVLDAEAGTLSAYCLSSHASHPVRSPQEALFVRLDAAPEPLVLSLAPVADELTGETAGDTSLFRVQDARLESVKTLAGSLGPIVLKGEEFQSVPFGGEAQGE